VHQRIYISDSNIWIDFGHAELLDELFTLPIVLASTDFVLAELTSPVPGVLLKRGLIVEELDADEVQQLSMLSVEHNNSSLADVSCYLVARSKGHVLLTGDGRLRKRALLDGVTVHGALWLLDALIEHHVITPMRAAEALKTMLLNNARLPRDECEARLALWLA
jgi:hypothetical protein